MRKHLLAAVAVLAAPMLFGSAAHASPSLSIGLQESGVNSGMISTVATSVTGFASFASTYGTFDFNSVTATGTPIIPSPNLDTTSLQTSSTVAGTINVFITEAGLTTPQGVNSFLSAFTSNVFNGTAASVVEKTFVSAANATYTGTLLASQSFSGLGATASTNNTPSLSGPFSETIEYTITVGAGAADVNDTVDIASVPEPISLALLGSGLVGFGLVRRRKV